MKNRTGDKFASLAQQVGSLTVIGQYLHLPRSRRRFESQTCIQSGVVTSKLKRRLVVSSNGVMRITPHP
ncbi:hypothetical protein EVAR_57848_1 [Eumeta japonica]|uniref:Uncharacterized protein n=1 Tax=Eumeta variegata TaxID=151549 RepID=A0A4C1YUT4_EUMVA|nr:hypothetical protein EVAR_57848_1 [Eumeta japonica]